MDPSQARPGDGTTKDEMGVSRNFPSNTRPHLCYRVGRSASQADDSAPTCQPPAH